MATPLAGAVALVWKTASAVARGSGRGTSPPGVVLRVGDCLLGFRSSFECSLTRAYRL